MFRSQLRPAVLIFIVLTVITGILYPLFVTFVAQIFFHEEARGSIIYRDGTITGSKLVGQPFDDPRYLWGRISATTPQYNASASSGSNIGPSNPALIDEIKARIKALKDADPDNQNSIPADLVTSSASGIDPHISIAAAYYQIPRIAKARSTSPDAVKGIIDKNTTGRAFGLLGEPVVNVLGVNLDLDSHEK